MATTGGRPKDQKRLVKHVRRAKAPLAAQFEDCVQASIRLTDALQANRPRLNKLRDLGQECKDRLAFWGENSGATTRTLDYNLKCSPALVHQTQALLDDLNTALTEAAPLVRPLVFEAEPHNLHTEKAAVAAILEDYDVDFSPELWVTEAVDVVDYLVKLLPAYRDHLGEEAPTPTSLNSEDDSGEFSADWYTKEAAGLFPAASRPLQERLGRVNWRRRQYLNQIRARPRTATETATAIATVKVSPHSELGHTTKTTSTPRSTGRLTRPPTVVHVQPPSRQTTQSWADFSDTATTTETQITSIVSRATDADQNSTYTVTESLQSTSLPNLTLPAPPVDLENVQNGSFECSICHFELPLTVSAPKVTPDDWVDHVYLDLKPYMCTFDGCSWGNAMYGVKRDWFQHELDCHRSSTVWSCGICRSDFGSETEFSDHLDQHDIGSKKPASVVDSCKRFSPKDHPYLECRLCHESCHDLGELEDHVGNHLEYFALAALLEHSPVTLPDATAPEDYTNIHDYLADLSDDEGQQVQETKTIRASSPPAVPNNTVPGPPPTEGSRVADASDISIPDDPDKEFPHQRDPTRTATAKQVVEQKVGDFLKQARQAAPIYQKPQASNVPMRDEKFFGRDVDLERMHSSLSQMGRICTVTGRGGIGKTATAQEYLHRYRDEYGFIFWVDAESPGVLQRQYLMIADIMDTGGTSLHDESNRIIFVRECLSRSERRWLLALDNVPAWVDIARYIPRSLTRTRGSVLVTIRGTDALTVPSTYIQDHIHLEPWSISHSREFLLVSISKNIDAHNLKEHEEYNLAEDVVEKVDRLPLAVNMVVGYVKVSRCSLQEFLEMWEEKAARRRPNPIRKTGAGIDPTIDSLWEIGIGEVRANCRKLLDVLSFFGSETIPKNLLVGAHEEDYLDFLHDESILR